MHFFFVVEVAIKCECKRGLPFVTISDCEIYSRNKLSFLLKSIGLGLLWFKNSFEITLSHVFLKEETIILDSGRFVLCRCIGGMGLLQKKRLRRWRHQTWKGGDESEEIGPEVETGAGYFPPWSPNADPSHP